MRKVVVTRVWVCSQSDGTGAVVRGEMHLVCMSCAHVSLCTRHPPSQSQSRQPWHKHLTDHRLLLSTPGPGQQLGVLPIPPAMATKDALPYTASVNPPRKAKRPRLETDPALAATTTTTTITIQPRPQLLPTEAFAPRRLDDSPEQDSSDDEGDDYDPVEPAPPPKRRGRKPGPMSRSARESQRKLNHSRIEKARRTKINETLATLSNLVSENEKQKSSSVTVVEVPVEKEKAKGEKEFKLDVLVKTVTYIQELIQKVQDLEIRASASTCARCSQPPSGVSSLINSPPSPSTKRKRAQTDHGEHVHDYDYEIPTNTATRPSSLPPPAIPPPTNAVTSRRLTSASPALHPISASPSLPPISSWLPHPYDPSSLPTIPSPSPDLMINPSSHLPTPPLSGSFRPPLAHTTQTLPALSLPGPAHPSLSSSFASDERKTMRIPIPPRRMSAASSTSTSYVFSTKTSASNYRRGISQSPTVSPSWTPEDESAASLLLQMSSSPTGSSAGGSGGVHRKSFGSVGSLDGESMRVMGERERSDDVRGKERMQEKRREGEGDEKPLHAETPSSLLGITRSLSQKERA